jgi:rhodanese-related sulfurtransferase
MRTLSPAELKALLDRQAVCLLDVREPEELELARLPGAVHIPLAELPKRLAELDPQRPIVAFCHHGVRSELAARLLERNGFTEVAHLSGGIDAWAQTVDPALPRY